MKYSHSKIEKKWQKIWARHNFRIWHASDNPTKKHIYILDMFPYPSGEGLHVGHVEGYTASDILSRFYRMQGYDVLHPMGWDAFGLPAENYALKTKKPPQDIVPKNIKRFKEQLRALGFSYDWSREINTTDPNYYKWTQWIFLQLFKKGLAYEEEAYVNWCPNCKTVLADEEVEEGKCDRCGTEVERKKLKQWVLKITAYADRLLKDLDLLAWPERVKTMQRNWIGRSEGVEITFKIADSDRYLKVFTTRPDTLFGATYLVLAPEHPLINDITSSTYQNEVRRYIEESLKKSDFERQTNIKEKTGVFTGTYAINPANKERIPIWISDYVLMNYGTGAIMAVPAHDERDFSFAQEFHLMIKEVISPDGKEHLSLDKPYTGEGILVNSGPFDGIHSTIAREKITFYVNGQKVINYKLRDWIFSRQRYWGEPIPIIKCPRCGNVAVPEKDLPLKLPMIKKYEPTGEKESPLADISSWVKVKCPQCGGEALRETNTMPQWAGSSWYYLRYLDPKNKKFLVDPKKEKTWLPVNIYIGGVEHAVLHLLYARFWHKFLYDIGVVSTLEPFHKLINQGIILGEDGEKMSKSRGNVINPDSIIKQYGADSLRMYEMFLGPLAFSKPWSSQGIIGIYRYLNRVWDLIVNSKNFDVIPAKAGIRDSHLHGNDKLRRKDEFIMTPEAKKQLNHNLEALERIRHRTIQKVTEDIKNCHFNTAISSLMEYTNKLTEIPTSYINKKYFDTLVILLSPFAPHLSEELWHSYLKHRRLVAQEPWPTFSKKYLEDKNITIVIQVNGRIRGTVEVAKDSSQEKVQKEAKSIIKKYLTGQNIRKVIFVPNKLINFVIKS
ncbi:MAG: leucine--tRNA ligase [Parcubacteria group bacterium]|nr:leucine--tRNA ligase [Parcubacteria group bacterium]